MVAPPMPREVRIKVICSSLCHTDIGLWVLKVVISNHIYSLNFTFMTLINSSKFVDTYAFFFGLKDLPGIYPRVLGHEAIGLVLH